MAPAEPPRRAADLGLGEDEARRWRPFKRRSPSGRRIVGLQGSPATPRGLGPLWVRAIDGRPAPQLLPGFDPASEPPRLHADQLRGPLLFLEAPRGPLSLIVPLQLPDGSIEALPIGGAAARLLRRGSGALQSAVGEGWSFVLAQGQDEARVIAGLRAGRREPWPAVVSALDQAAPLARVLDQRRSADPDGLLLLAASWSERAGAVLVHLPRAAGAPYWRFAEQISGSSMPAETRSDGLYREKNARSKARSEKGR